MATPMYLEIFRQLLDKPFTNPFPVKYAPKNMHAALEAIKAGKVKIHPPVPVPDDFRGKIAYDRDACIGCRMCIKVCPANAIEYVPPPDGGPRGGKVKFYMSRCTFCALCTEICPKHCISMTTEFLMADTDKNSPNLVITDSGKTQPPSGE